MESLPLQNNLLKYKVRTTRAGRFGAGLFLAAAITGANWYIQTKLAYAEQLRQQEIIKRVNNKITVEADKLLDLTKVNQIEGARVQLKGNLQPGRFIVKRKRGDQEGYIVLAPFVIKSQNLNDFKGKMLNTKFMLNLGWVPKDSKHKIRQTAAVDILSFDQLPEQLANDEDAPTSVSVTAYVRKGEQRDLLRGYNNWANDSLFKYIDLDLMQRIFVSRYASFRHVYLDRIGEQGAVDAFPFPNNNDNYTEQLKEQISYNNKKRATIAQGVGLVSFATAALLAAL